MQQGPSTPIFVQELLFVLKICHIYNMRLPLFIEQGFETPDLKCHVRSQIYDMEKSEKKNIPGSLPVTPP